MISTNALTLSICILLSHLDVRFADDSWVCQIKLQLCMYGNQFYCSSKLALLKMYFVSLRSERHVTQNIQKRRVWNWFVEVDFFS